MLVIVVIEDALGKHAEVSFGEVSKPLEELLVENSIFLRSPRLVLLELPQRIYLWVIQLALVVARAFLSSDPVPDFDIIQM
jgi:hypothetical protein